MGDGVIERRDALEIVIGHAVLLAGARARRLADQALDRGDQRAEDGDGLEPEIGASGLDAAAHRLISDGEPDRARVAPDRCQGCLEIALAAHEDREVHLDRGSVRGLERRKGRAGKTAQGLAGRIGYQVKMELAVGHRTLLADGASLCCPEHGVKCVGLKARMRLDDADLASRVWCCGVKRGETGYGHSRKAGPVGTTWAVGQIIIGTCGRRDFHPPVDEIWWGFGVPVGE